MARKQTYFIAKGTPEEAFAAMRPVLQEIGDLLKSCPLTEKKDRAYLGLLIAGHFVGIASGLRELAYAEDSETARKKMLEVLDYTLQMAEGVTAKDKGQIA